MGNTKIDLLLCVELSAEKKKETYHTLTTKVTQFIKLRLPGKAKETTSSCVSLDSNVANTTAIWWLDFKYTILYTLF